MDGYYEHHISIKRDRLCPFKITELYDMHSTPCNWHENIELLYVTEGYGDMLYGGKSIPITRGDVVIVNSGIIHRPTSESGISCYYIIIDEDFCIENGIDTPHLLFKEKVRDTETEKCFLSIVEEAKRYKRERLLINAARLRSAVLRLLIDVCEKHSTVSTLTERSLPSAEYAKAVIEYVNENYCKPVSLDSLADFCGVTKFHLSREFKRLTGQTILTYTNILRCKKAEAMISEGKSVTEAAFESGFSSLSYFSRTYKKLMSEVPSKMCTYKGGTHSEDR